MNWRIRLALAPAWIPFLVLFAVVAATLPFFWGHERTAIIAAAGVGLVAALALTVLLHHIRRRQWAVIGASTRADQIMIMRALQTGEPPANPAFDDGLLTLVAKRRANARLTPWFAIVMTLLYLPVGIVGHQARSIVFTCGWALLAVFAWTERVHAGRRLARLEDGLSRRSAGAGRRSQAAGSP